MYLVHLVDVPEPCDDILPREGPVPRTGDFDGQEARRINEDFSTWMLELGETQCYLEDPALFTVCIKGYN